MVNCKGKLIVIFFLVPTVLVGLGATVTGQLSVKPVKGEKGVPPDEFASLVFSVTNESGSKRTVSYELTLPTGWVAMGQPSPTEIPAGEKESIFVTVQVPATAEAGDYSVELTASYDSEEASGEAEVSVKGIKEVEITAPAPRTVGRNTTFSYEFTVKNTGNISDTFYLEASSGHGWVKSVSPESVQLFPGSTKVFNVKLTVPDDAKPGRDSVTVSAVSARDDNITDQEVIFTRLLPPSPQAVGGELYALLPATLRGNFSRDPQGDNKSGYLNLTGEGDIGTGTLYFDFGLFDLYETEKLNLNALDYGDENYEVNSGNVGSTFSDLISVYGKGISTNLELGKFDIYLIDLIETPLSGGGSLSYGNENLSLSANFANHDGTDGPNFTETVLGKFNPGDGTKLELEGAYTPSGGEEGGGFRAYGSVDLETIALEGEAFYIGTNFGGDDTGEKGFRISQNSLGEYFDEEIYYSYTYRLPAGVQTKSTLRTSRLAATTTLDLLRLKEAEGEGAETEFYFSGFAEFVDRKDVRPDPSFDETKRGARGSLTYESKDIAFTLRGAQEVRTNRLSGETLRTSSISQDFEYSFDGIMFSAEVSSELTENLTSGETVATSGSTSFGLETLDSPEVVLSVSRSEDSTDFYGEATVSPAGDLEFIISADASTKGESLDFESSLDFTYDFDLPLEFLVTKGRIDGSVFVDKNGNGKKEDGEEGIEDLVLVVENTRVSTGEDGYFKLPPFPPGNYELDIDNLPVNYSSDGVLPLKVRVNRGESRTVEVPLTELGEIRVQVFGDEDQNGSRSSDESGLSGIGLNLEGEGHEERRFTKDTGRVNYRGLLPGEYNLKLDKGTLPPRSEITTDNGEIMLELTRGETEELEVGIYQEPREIIFGQPPEADFLYAPRTPEPETVVNFSGGLSSDPDGEIVRYEWDFQNDGEIDKEDKIVSHSFGGTGTFEVLLRVTDDEGNTDSTTKTVEVVKERS